MSSSFDLFMTGGALQGAAVASLLRERQRAAELVPGALVGPFRILGELGRGGMAIVYRAERADGEYEQQVALKWMIDPRPDAASEALFRRERQALADLRHPHIARLLDGGHSPDGRPWLAMELIDGECIEHHCVALKLPLKPCLALFDQVCSAVGFAHARGLIHRDIKPSNVLIDADGSAKLLDFGIAQLLDSDDQPLAHAFTPGFASPEQRRGEAPTVASDIFQLGALLACVLKRQGSTVDGQPSSGRVTGEADPSDTEALVPPWLPADLGAVLRKALDPDPGRRHESVTALAADLRAVVEHRPVSARPRRPAYLVSRFVRRNPVGTVASLAAILVLVLSSLAFTLRLASERDRAEYQARVANAVLQFLREDLLAAADPAAVPGRELSVREALDAAAQSVEQRFGEAPTERAAIRSTLARLYLDLGRVGDSEAQTRLALAEAHALPHEGHVWELHKLLHRSLLEQTRFEEATTLLDDYATLHPPEARRAIDIDLLRALTAHGQGRYEESERLAQTAIERVENLPDAASFPVSALQSARADSLLMLGRQEEALSLARSLLSEEQQRFGPKHPRSLLEAHRVGQILRHLRRLDEAEAVLVDTLRKRDEVLGEGHHQTLASANELATVLQEQQRYVEAEVLFRRVLQARLALFGEQHLYTRNSMSNLGLLYQTWGRLEEATALNERALAIELALPGERHPDTVALMHNIAGLYRRQERFADALSMHSQAIEHGERLLGADAWQLGFFRVGLAQTLNKSGSPDAAETEFEQAIAILASSLGEDSPRTQRARGMLEELRAGRRQPQGR
jgi:eukaryotic-like serine/threonine-protein kinase